MDEAEVVSPARQRGEDRLSNLEDARALRVERHKQEDRVPRSDLQAGAIGGQGRHRDHVDEHQEPERALGAITHAR